MDTSTCSVHEEPKFWCGPCFQGLQRRLRAAQEERVETQRIDEAAMKELAGARDTAIERGKKVYWTLQDLIGWLHEDFHPWVRQAVAEKHTEVATLRERAERAEALLRKGIGLRYEALKAWEKEAEEHLTPAEAQGGEGHDPY